MTIRLAILGGGHGLAVHLPAAREAKGITPVMLCGGGQAPPPGMRRATRWQDAVADPAVDAVVVALPPPAQREAVLAAAAAGKAVLCEKPAGMSAAEATHMADACDAAGVVHAVGFQFRFEPGLAKLRDILREGVLGNIARIDVDWMVGTLAARQRPWTWRNARDMGGGVSLNFASHVLDYLGWLRRMPLSCVQAHESILIQQRVDASGGVRHVDAPDAFDALLRYPDGVLANVRICNQVLSGGGHTITVWGEAGTARLNWRPPFGPADVSLTLATSDGIADLLLPSSSPARADSRIGPTISLLEAFAQRLAGEEGAELATLRHAADAHRLLAAATWDVP